MRETQVGDRYVLEALNAEGLTLGGEQSGHIVFRELATTGDGVLTGILLLDLISAWARPWPSWPPASMQRLPQVLWNVAGPRAGPRRDRRRGRRPRWRPWSSSSVSAGRVLLRASGTEPLVRVMVEADDEAQARAAAERLCAVVERGLVRPGSSD